MAVVYRLGQATIAEIVAHLPDPPTADAVRRLTHILEEKGLLRHEQDGPRNVYYPTIKLERASKSALDHLMETFFAGSPRRLIAALLDIKKDELDETERRRLAAMIEAVDHPEEQG
jgi:predicted transcriptional regulator